MVAKMETDKIKVNWVIKGAGSVDGKVPEPTGRNDLKLSTETENV